MSGGFLFPQPGEYSHYVNGQYASTITPMGGLDIEAAAGLVALHALLSNPHYAPFSFAEIATKAKEVSRAYVAAI